MLYPSQILDSHQLSALFVPYSYQVLFYIQNTNIVFLFRIQNKIHHYLFHIYKKSEPLNTVRKYGFAIETND